jgi:uncharacterized GH25 family protein
MVQKAFQKEAFSPFFEEDLLDIVRGHEIWVENCIHNFSPGDPIVCDLCFGHNMKSEAVKIEKVTPAVFGTWGKIMPLRSVSQKDSIWNTYDNRDFPIEVTIDQEGIVDIDLKKSRK